MACPCCTFPCTACWCWRKADSNAAVSPFSDWAGGAESGRWAGSRFRFLSSSIGRFYAGWYGRWWDCQMMGSVTRKAVTMARSGWTLADDWRFTPMITGHRQEILQLLERLSELTGIRAGHNENGPLNRRSGSLRRTSLKPIRTVE